MTGTELLGLVMIYSWVHTVIMMIQKRAYETRTQYEKVVTIVAWVGIALVIIGVMTK